MGTLLNRRRYMGGGEEPWVDKGYLTFLAEESGTFSFTMVSQRTVDNIGSISYSLDNGKNWVTLTNDGSTQQTITTPTVAAGARVIWKGSIKYLGEGRTDNLRRSGFSSTKKFSAYGNLLSLCWGDDFDTHIDTFISGSTCTFDRLFYESKITDISGLVFPKESTDRCYNAMFKGCTSLVNAGTTIYLSTTDTGNRNTATCDSMFYGCSSLVTVPSLPATTLLRQCYAGMFKNCTSLQAAPLLPALTVSYYGYYLMFNGCSKLNSVTMYATNIGATSAVGSMLTGVAAEGTFGKNSAATWTGVVPSGWTINYITV